MSLCFAHMLISVESFVRRVVRLWSSAEQPTTFTSSSTSHARNMSRKWSRLLRAIPHDGLKPKASKSYWQRGYGCFSVGQSQVQALIRYIENQADHHLKLTFQDEFRQFLRRYEISFEEQYVWD